MTSKAISLKPKWYYSIAFKNDFTFYLFNTYSARSNKRTDEMSVLGQLFRNSKMLNCNVFPYIFRQIIKKCHKKEGKTETQILISVQLAAYFSQNR